MKTKGKIGRFLPYYKKYKGTLIMDLFCAALTTLCEIVLPLIVREITDRATKTPELITLDFIAKCGIVYLVLRIIDAAAYYYMSAIGHVMGTKIETDLRRDMFSHLQKLPFSYYDNTKIGTLMSRITSDLFDVTEFAHHCPEEFFIAGIKMVVAFVILARVNVGLTLIIFMIVPVMILVCMKLNFRMKSIFRVQRSHIGELNARIEDSLLGHKVVKAFTNEEVEKAKAKTSGSLL